MASNCVLWTNRPNKRNGYGYKKVDGKSWLAHRLIFTQTFGEIPQGMDVLHRCDVPNCVNLDHLFLGSHEDNVNTPPAKAGGFFGEPSYCRACTQQARSGPDLSVDKHLTAKLALILGDPGRVLPAAVSSNRSDFALEVLPTARRTVERHTSQRTGERYTLNNNLLSAIPPSAKADGPLAS